MWVPECGPEVEMEGEGANQGAGGPKGARQGDMSVDRKNGLKNQPIFV